MVEVHNAFALQPDALSCDAVFSPSVRKLDTADLNITLRLRLKPSHNGDVKIASALGQIKLK